MFFLWSKNDENRNTEKTSFFCDWPKTGQIILYKPEVSLFFLTQLGIFYEKKWDFWFIQYNSNLDKNGTEQGKNGQNRAKPSTKPPTTTTNNYYYYYKVWKRTCFWGFSAGGKKFENRRLACAKNLHFYSLGGICPAGGSKMTPHTRHYLNTRFLLNPRHHWKFPYIPLHFLPNPTEPCAPTIYSHLSRWKKGTSRVT